MSLYFELMALIPLSSVTRTLISQGTSTPSTSSAARTLRTDQRHEKPLTQALSLPPHVDFVFDLVISSCLFSGCPPAVSFQSDHRHR